MLFLAAQQTESIAAEKETIASPTGYARTKAALPDSVKAPARIQRMSRYHAQACVGVRMKEVKLQTSN